MVELLGIVEAARHAVGIEDDGGGDHGTGRADPARLVAARHRPDIGFQKRPLAAEGRRRTGRGAGFRFGFCFCGGGDCMTGPHCAAVTPRGQPEAAGEHPQSTGARGAARGSQRLGLFEECTEIVHQSRRGLTARHSGRPGAKNR